MPDLDHLGPLAMNTMEVLVTSANLASLTWNNYEDLIFSSVLSSISPHHLQNTKETLTKVSFWDNILFENVVSCLKHLPNLQSVCFLTANIDEFVDIHAPANYHEMIEASNLRSLTVIKDPRLQKDDYFLMDFFTRGVALGNLENFEFRGEDNFNFYSRTPDPDSEDPNPSPSNIDRAILAKFLIRNRSSLKHLEIRGPGVVLFENLTEELQDLLTVQVENLRYSMDNEEINYLVNQQNRLQQLTCHDYVYDFNIDKMSSLSSCITRNAATLTSIQIFPNILFDDISDNLLMVTTIDCRCFEQCVNLQRLQLNLELMNRRKEWESTKSGRVTNIPVIPRSLRQFNIISERVDDVEMDTLAGRLQDFDQLEFMCVESTVPNTFEVKLDWIRRLYELPQIKRILFNGATIDDIGGTLAFLNTRPDARGSMINDGELSIFMKSG